MHWQGSWNHSNHLMVLAVVQVGLEAPVVLVETAMGLGIACP